MDKETEEHLKEYKAQAGHLKARLMSVESLIADILTKEDESDGLIGEVHTAEHDFPNFRKYNKGTDI